MDPQTPVSVSFDDIHTLAQRKEQELKESLVKQQQHWQQELTTREAEMAVLKRKLLSLQEDFMNNFELLQDRDEEVNRVQSQLHKTTQSMLAREQELVEAQTMLQQQSLLHHDLEKEIQKVWEHCHEQDKTIKHVVARCEQQKQVEEQHQTLIQQNHQKLSEFKGRMDLAERGLGGVEEKLTIGFEHSQTIFDDINWRLQATEKVLLELDGRLSNEMDQLKAWVTQHVRSTSEALEKAIGEIHETLQSTLRDERKYVEEKWNSLCQDQAAMKECLLQEASSVASRDRAANEVALEDLRKSIHLHWQSIRVHCNEQSESIQKDMAVLVDRIKTNESNCAARVQDETKVIRDDMRALQNHWHSAMAEWNEKWEIAEARNKVLETRLIRQLEDDTKRHQHHETTTQSLVEENEGLKKIIALMREEMEQLQSEHMEQQQTLSQALSVNHTETPVEEVGWSQIEGLKGQVSGLIVTMEDLSAKMDRIVATSHVGSNYKPLAEASGYDQWKLIDMSNALRAEIKDLQQRNQELEARICLSTRTLGTQTKLHYVGRSKTIPSSENDKPPMVVQKQQTAAMTQQSYDRAKPVTKPITKKELSASPTRRIRNYNQKDE